MAPIRSTRGSRCATAGRTPGARAAAAAVVLLALLGAFAGGAEAANGFVIGGKYSSTGLLYITADDISYCLNAWVGWLNAAGTYLCPTNAALDAFAQKSGYDSFPDLAALWVAGASKKSLSVMPEGVSRGAPPGPGQQQGDAGATGNPAAEGAAGGVPGGARRRRALLDTYPLDPPLFVQRFFNYLTLQEGADCSDTHPRECAFTGFYLRDSTSGGPANFTTRLPTYSCVDADTSPLDATACDSYEALTFASHLIPTNLAGQPVFQGWSIPLSPDLDPRGASSDHAHTLFAFPVTGADSPFFSSAGVNLAPNLAYRVAQRGEGLTGPAVVHGIRAAAFDKGPLPSDEYLRPPRTYHTLAEAINAGNLPPAPGRNPPLSAKTTQAFLTKYLKTLTNRPALTGTFFAPTDRAWDIGLNQAPYANQLPPGFPAFAGMPNLRALQASRPAMSALLKYHFVRDRPLDWRFLLRNIALSSGRYIPFSILQVLDPSKAPDNVGQITERFILRTNLKPNQTYDYCAVGLRELGPPPEPGFSKDAFWGNYTFCSGIVNSFKQEIWGGGVVIQQIDGLPLLPWLFGTKAFDNNRTWIGDPPTSD